MLDNGLKVEEFFGSKHLSAVSDEASAYFQNSALLNCYPTQKASYSPTAPTSYQWLSYN